MAFKIAYGAGHNRYTPGKRLPRELDPNETREWFLNAQVAEAFAEAAAQYEDVEILRVDDPAGEAEVSLRGRCRDANNWGADFFLAIHHDAAGSVFNGGGASAHIIATGGRAEKYQKAIYEAVIDAGGIKGNRSQPLRVSNFYVLRNTDAPAVLMEYGFMDSRVDAPIIMDRAYSRKVAFGTMEGIAKVAGLRKKAGNPTPAPAPEPEDSGHMYRVRRSWEDSASQIGAYRVLENAQTACQTGYAVYDENGNEVYRTQRTHKVVSGDTLWDLAAHYLGSGSRYKEIAQANGLSGSVISVGQVLVIPEK